MKPFEVKTSSKILGFLCVSALEVGFKFFLKTFFTAGAGQMAGKPMAFGALVIGNEFQHHFGVAVGAGMPQGQAQFGAKPGLLAPIGRHAHVEGRLFDGSGGLLGGRPRFG
jgi:hypothetical protein